MQVVHALHTDMEFWTLRTSDLIRKALKVTWHCTYAFSVGEKIRGAQSIACHMDRLWLLGFIIQAWAASGLIL
jgi:hypothetical protein